MSLLSINPSTAISNGPETLVDLQVLPFRATCSEDNLEEEAHTFYAFGSSQYEILGSVSPVFSKPKKAAKRPTKKEWPNAYDVIKIVALGDLLAHTTATNSTAPRKSSIAKGPAHNPTQPGSPSPPAEAITSEGDSPFRSRIPVPTRRSPSPAPQLCKLVKPAAPAFRRHLFTPSHQTTGYRFRMARQIHET